MFGCRRLVVLVAVCCSVAGAQTGLSVSGKSDGGLGTQTQDARSEPMDSNRDEARGVSRKIPEDVVYYVFILFVGDDHRRIQQEMRDAKQGDKQVIEGKNWWESMRIRPEEFQLMQTYVLQAYDRLLENEREDRVALQAFQQANGGAIAASKVTPPLALIQLAKEHGEIIDGTMANLKYELGDESFGKLDAFIHRYWGGGRRVTLKPRTDASSQVQQGGGGAAGKASVGQP